MRLLTLLTAATLGLTSSAIAQPLSMYSNMQREVMVWDDGYTRKIDYLTPTLYKVGRVAIPYIDNANNFKIYYKGGVSKVNIGFTHDLSATDCLVAYRNATALNVFDRGTTTELTPRLGTEAFGNASASMPEGYIVADSIILFKDGLRNEYKAYYDGKIIRVEDYLASSAIQTLSVGDNIIAYQNFANHLKAIYHGNVLTLEEYPVEKFSAGRNTIAYVDANGYFKIFHNGKTEVYERFEPENYRVGDNLVAWLSAEGHFKIFYNGKVSEIGFFRPNYNVVDNIVSFEDAGGYFKAFYKGDIVTLDISKPKESQTQYHSLLFKNNYNIWKIFSQGEVYEVTSAQVDEINLTYDVVQYRVGNNFYKFFYKGKTY